MQEFDTLTLQETYMSLLLYHKIFAYFFALPFVLNLLVLFFGSHNLVKMNKKNILHRAYHLFPPLCGGA